MNAEDAPIIQIRQNKYLNNLIEQDHRAIKRRTRPMQGFKDAASAAIIPSGIELLHALQKGQLNAVPSPSRLRRSFTPWRDNSVRNSPGFA